MRKILLAGTILAEQQYFVNKIPYIGEASLADKVNSLTSSKIINAGRILAVGNKVDIFGFIGQDSNGQKAIMDLKTYNINTTLVCSVPKIPTGQVIVITNKAGQSVFIVYLSANDCLDGSKLKNFSDYDYIYTATNLKLAQLYKLIERASNDGVRVFLDVPNQQKELDKRCLRSVDFVVPNRQEAELLLETKISSIPDALEAVTELKSYAICGNAIITLDQDGCVVFAKDWNQPKYFPTHQVKMIDNAGSGDIFRGVLLREYLKTENIEVSVEKALQLVTRSVTFKGVNNSIDKMIHLLTQS